MWTLQVMHGLHILSAAAGDFHLFLFVDKAIFVSAQTELGQTAG